MDMGLVHLVRKIMNSDGKILCEAGSSCQNCIQLKSDKNVPEIEISGYLALAWIDFVGVYDNSTQMYCNSHAGCYSIQTITVETSLSCQGVLSCASNVDINNTRNEIIAGSMFTLKDSTFSSNISTLSGYYIQVIMQQ